MTISHLSETERMFFVSLLLTQLLGWMRTQPGTSSLRALFYMDEIFGYFPPVANPPSKGPLLTLLKQARAYGLGILLATQNPVDLDYKGLSNCGTWFLGRLQTERDKDRVLDGLEGVGSSVGGRFDRSTYDKILTSLGKRVFLMNNVHEDEPVIFQTRWVLSYLSGPMTRSQIKILMDQRRKVIHTPPSSPIRSSPPPSAFEKSASPGNIKPILPPFVPEVFLPIQEAPPYQDAVMVYRPRLFARGKIYYTSAKLGVSTEEEISLLAEPSSSIQWEKAQKFQLGEKDLDQSPVGEDVFFLDPPKDAMQPKIYNSWEKDFKDWVYRNHELKIFRSPSLGSVSKPGESEAEFRIRIQQVGREKRDELVEKVTKKFSTRIVSIENQILRAQQAVDREKDQVGQQRLQTAISFGATLFEAMVGRKKVSRSSLGRATTTVQRAGRISREAKDVQRAEERLSNLQSNLENLQNQFEEEIGKVKASVDPLTESLETITIQPRKSDIAVTLFALGWQPSWQGKRG
jgi:hypothetical protein